MCRQGKTCNTRVTLEKRGAKCKNKRAQIPPWSTLRLKTIIWGQLPLPVPRESLRRSLDRVSHFPVSITNKLISTSLLRLEVDSKSSWADRHCGVCSALVRKGALILSVCHCQRKSYACHSARGNILCFTDDAFFLGILLYDGLFGEKNRWNFQN